MQKIVSISGGKDSTATMLWVINNSIPEDSLDFVFCDTGNESVVTYDYIDYLDSWLKQKGLKGITRLMADFSSQINKRREKISSDPQVSQEWNTAQREVALDNLKPSGNPFLDLCLLKGCFPSFSRRFCTKNLKSELIKKFILKILGGVRTAKTIVAFEQKSLRKEPCCQNLNCFFLTRALGLNVTW